MKCRPKLWIPTMALSLVAVVVFLLPDQFQRQRQRKQGDLTIQSISGNPSVDENKKTQIEIKQIPIRYPIEHREEQRTATGVISESTSSLTQNLCKSRIPFDTSKRKAVQFSLSKFVIEGPTSTAEEKAEGEYRLHQLHIRKDNFTDCKVVAPFQGPFPYLPTTKNPCWIDSGRLRCVPYFYLPGFGKCGTTDLMFRISNHPLIVNSDKEKHWFNYFRYRKEYKSITSYTHTFANATRHIQDELCSKGKSDIITGDGTPAYLCHSLYWKCAEGNQNLEEPLYTNPHYIHRLNPKAKFVVMMREPAKRLYSEFLFTIPLRKSYRLHYGEPSPQKFHDAVTNALSVYRDCFRTKSMRHCVFNGTLLDDVFLNLQSGMYIECLRDWLKIFPRDQFLFIVFEDYVVNPGSYLRKVFEFLELPPLNETGLSKMVSGGAINKGPGYGKGQMLNDTRSILRQFYRPFVTELRDLVKVDKIDLWGYS